MNPLGRRLSFEEAPMRKVKVGLIIGLLFPLILADMDASGPPSCLGQALDRHMSLGVKISSPVISPWPAPAETGVPEQVQIHGKHLA